MRLKTLIIVIFLQNVLCQNDSMIENESTTQIRKNLNTFTPYQAIVPYANVKNQISRISGSKNQNEAPVEFCPSLENADLLTDEEFFSHLVHPCRYDRIQRPKQMDKEGIVLPVNVYTRFYIYYLQNLDTQNLEFKMQVLLQMRFVDPRLTFKDVAPQRTHSIKGQEDLRAKIWVPHVFFSNERESKLLGTYGHHILTSISPDGTVIISSRLQATLFCPMDLKKFPFDEQMCRASLECWMYNASQVQLHWEMTSPLTMGVDKILTEYVLTKTFTNETMIIADEHDLRHGAFVGNYTSITFYFNVVRQTGFYILEYFLPSILIVAISWVSFWLQADQTAPRAMLGATSMLSFITLSAAQNKILPKVSYIKASEIWSMTCTGFIFGSLVEFAFVNTIWRRRKAVELKKVNAANILKHTIPAREIRMALGIDTSRSVHYDVQNEIIREEDENSVRTGRRRSIDSSIKNNDGNEEFTRSRLSSFRSLKKFDGNSRKNSIAVLNGIINKSYSPDNTIVIKKTSFEHNNISHVETNTEKNAKHDEVQKEAERTRKISKIHLARRDSSGKLHKIDDLGHRRKSIMLPIVLTEDDNGEFKMEMDTNHVQLSDDNDSVEIVMDEDIESSKQESTHHHHSIYDGWTRMTPKEISHWIDKRSRTFFPGAFFIFNVFYWTFVYLF